jgi:hypothetical protein
MGAGNYYFSAPAGDEWHAMVYVDLEPNTWQDEMEAREQAVQEYLSNDFPKPLPDNLDLDQIRDTWLDENWGGTNSEQFFNEEQRDFQHESVYAALNATFPNVDFNFYGRGRKQAVIGDAEILGQIGRMVIARSYTYYGDRMALIVTPETELQDYIRIVTPETELQEYIRYNAKLFCVKRSLNFGALAKEMVKVFDSLLLGLHENGLADDMSFRSSAWTASPYIGSDSWAKNKALLVTKKARLAAKEKRKAKEALKKQVLREALQGGQPDRAWAF